MPSHYTDDEGTSSRSSSRSGGASRSSGNGSSATSGPGSNYTDRFRLDGNYTAPVLQAGGQPSVGRLLTLIERAVRPTLREPDLALNLQIADIINEKKGTAPREAATAIVNQINSRNSHVAILAISVLDVCVKNCGYPFHLQISRKDFLNSLVKRFPERPPLHYSRVQLLILECIEEWRETIARTSKYRDDLGYIRDMHRLLAHKGYMFPEVNRDDAAVLNAPETLKSASELEQEDREAQSAKLQELIRSGTPQDLREANHLMSIMAGFRESKTDYNAKVAKELDKIRSKGEILEEMLNTVKAGEPIANDDVFSELVVSLRNAKPKIERIIQTESETEDEEGVKKLIAIGDYINGLIAKYDLVSKGDWEGAQNVKVESMARSRKIDTSRQAVIDSLIDIDDAPASSSGSGDATSAADLLGLDFGGLVLGGGNATPGTAAAPLKSNSDITDLFGQPASRPPAPVPKSPQQPSVGAGAGGSSLDIFGEWAGSSSSPAPQARLTSSPAKTINLIDSEELRLDFVVTKTANDTKVVATFSNPTDKKITSLKLELASAKNRVLKLEPPTSTSIEARQQNGITQAASIEGTDPVKLRWRATFKLGLSEVNLSGLAKDI